MVLTYIPLFDRASTISGKDKGCAVNHKKAEYKATAITNVMFVGNAYRSKSRQMAPVPTATLMQCETGFDPVARSH